MVKITVNDKPATGDRSVIRGIGREPWHARATGDEDQQKTKGKTKGDKSNYGKTKGDKSN